MGRAFHARRNQSGCNYGRLQQSQIVPSKIEHFTDVGTVGLRVPISTAQAQDRFEHLIDPAPGLLGPVQQVIGPVCDTQITLVEKKSALHG